MSPQADETTDGENTRMDVNVNGQKIIKRSCEPRVRWRMNGHQVAGPNSVRMSIGTGTTVECPAIEKEEDMRKRGRLEKDEERMPDADPSVDGRRVSRERGDSGEARETLQRFQREEGGRREKMPTKRGRTRK